MKASCSYDYVMKVLNKPSHNNLRVIKHVIKLPAMILEFRVIIWRQNGSKAES